MSEKSAEGKAGNATIAIQRSAEGKRDAIRRYKIYVDGRRVSSIRRGARREIDVAPGVHVVQLRIDWCSSPALEVSLGNGQTAVLLCRPMPKPPDPMGAITVDRRNYIRLERTDGPIQPGGDGEDNQV